VKPIRVAIDAAKLPAEWPGIVREIALREGNAVRAGAGATIEVQLINTGEFRALMLPNGGTCFVSDSDRDLVLRQIHEGNKI
jgi:hypothetical protein